MTRVNLGAGACSVRKMAKGGVVKMKKGGTICPEGRRGQSARLTHIRQLMLT